MDMSLDYMRESCDFMKTKGFHVTSHTESVPQPHETSATLHSFELKRGEREHFILETWCYPDGIERYYLEIVSYHQITCTSFPLDSWKYKPHQIEFKYYVLDDTSMGLSFILKLEDTSSA